MLEHCSEICFKKACDFIILESSTDPKLKMILDYLNEKAFKLNIDIYEMIARVVNGEFQKHG